LSPRVLATPALALVLAIGAFAQPGTVADFGHDDSFPAVVDDYARAEVHAFAPEMSDFSIGYAGSRRPLVSQQVRVFRDKGIFMVRSTPPKAQGEAAEQAMLALVQHVDRDPCRIAERRGTTLWS